MSKLVLVFLFVLVFIQTLCMALTIARINSTQERFRVEENMFRHAVNFAVSNYLSNVEKKLSPDRTVMDVDPVVVYCDLGTWEVSSGSGCQIDGVRLRIGDYCQYGLVVNITSSSVICKSTDGITILKRRISPGPGEAKTCSPPGSGESAL